MVGYPGIERKFQPGTPQNCAANDAYYNKEGICDLSQDLKAIDCIYINTNATGEVKVRDQDKNAFVLTKCYGCSYKK